MDHDDPKHPDAGAPPPDPMRELEQMIGRFTTPPAASPSEGPGGTAPEQVADASADTSEDPKDPSRLVEPVSEDSDYDPLEAPTLSLGEILRGPAAPPETDPEVDGSVSATLDPVSATTKDVEPAPTPEGPALEDLVARLDAIGAGTLAGLPSPTATTVERSRLERAIVFSIGGTRYAFAMGQVTEVGPVPAVTPLPRVPEWLLGVTNLRGDVLAVLDLRRFLGRPTLEGSDRHRLLVLHAEDGRRSAGVVVDRVYGASSIDPETIRSPTAPVDDPVHPFLRGVTEQDERLLAILDAEKLLHASELEQFAA